jgi:hypothetical protein
MAMLGTANKRELMAGKTSVPRHFGSILVGRKVRDYLNIRWRFT